MKTVESVLIDKINELESELREVKFREVRLRNMTSRLIGFFPRKDLSSWGGLE